MQVAGLEDGRRRTVNPGYNKPAYNELMEDIVYNEDVHNLDRDQFIWVTPIAVMKSWV